MTYLLAPILMLAAAADPPEATASLLDGRELSGQLVAWNPDGVALMATKGLEKFTTDELLRIRWKSALESAETPSMWIELGDGTRLPITAFTVKDRLATVATPYAENSLKLRTELIRSVEFQPSTEAAAAVWQQLEDQDLAGDALIVS